MIKEYIQALNDLFGLVAFLPRGSFERAQKYFDILEPALQRLEAIDNVNPSEALECLNKIGNSNYFFGNPSTVDKTAFGTIKQALIQAEKDKIQAERDKRFKEIVLEYKVDLWLISQCDYENYIRIRKECDIENESIASDTNGCIEDVIPEEEFDFLKEMLK